MRYWSDSPTEVFIFRRFFERVVLTTCIATAVSYFWAVLLVQVEPSQYLNCVGVLGSSYHPGTSSGAVDVSDCERESIAKSAPIRQHAANPKATHMRVLSELPEPPRSKLTLEFLLACACA